MHHRSSSKKTYILTLDLGQKFQFLKGVGLSVPKSEDKFFTDFNSELSKMIQDAMPTVQIKTICMKDMSERIKEEAFKRRRFLRNAVIVSSCLEIASPLDGWVDKGYVLQINRLVDIEGHIIGLGSRPGYPDIDHQINEIKSMVVANNNSPLIVVEDGSFSGKTLRFILNKFETAGLCVDAIVVGFSFQKARKELKSVFSGELIIIDEFGEIIDWMPDHDFVPFSPNCGRVFGVKIGSNNYPFYTHNNATYSFPYLLPFSPMSEWTSIPKSAIRQISLFCVRQTLDLFREIEKINNKTVVIGDLVGVRPKISIPISVNQTKFPSLNESVCKFLSDVCHELV